MHLRLVGDLAVSFMSYSGAVSLAAVPQGDAGSELLCARLQMMQS